MQQRREQFPGNVRDEEDFYAAQRERRADQRRRRPFIEEVNNSNPTLDEEDPRWDDLWTAVPSDEE
jgi:hypothetical protein